MQKKKICIAVTVPESLYYLQSNLIEDISSSFDVTFLSSNGNWTSLTAVEKAYSIKIFQVPFNRTISPFRDIWCIFYVFFKLLLVRPAILHYSTPKASFICSIAGFLARIPFRLYTIRGQVYSKNPFSPKGRLLGFLDRLVCALSHGVILVSPSLKCSCRRLHICPVRKMRILGNGSSQGVDAQSRFNPSSVSLTDKQSVYKRFSIPSTAIPIGYVGRIVFDKGICDLIDAWQIVKRNNARCVLLLVGPYEKDISKLPAATIDSIQNDPTIIPIGAQAKMQTTYSILSILVHPSHREGFPNVVLEAGAMRIPVITTDAVGCTDSVIHDKTGLKVPVGCVQSLAEAILFLSSNEKMRISLGSAAREHVLTRYAPVLIKRDLLEIYRTSKLSVKES